MKLPLPCCLALAVSALSLRAVEVPSGFAVDTLATGLNAATAFALSPDGRIFIADQTGPIRVWQNGALLDAPAINLADRLDTYWERGLIGLTLHPDFPRTPHVFVLYVAKSPHTHHVLSRFTAIGDAIDPGSEKILLVGDDQKTIGGSKPGGHQGGPLRFGPDGKLYVSIGEQTAKEPAQSLAHLQGKILRVNPDGLIPDDNPFVGRTADKYRAIWALGIRNTFGLAFEPGTGRLFATDVGQTGWEEVNIIERGANYGWPHAEGMSTELRFTNPVHAYPPAIGRSIVGAAFLQPPAAGEKPWPVAWRGKFFFADWAANWIKAMDTANPADVVTFARGLAGPVALDFASDGSLLVLNRSTIWRDGKRWQPRTGSLLRIRHTGVPHDTAAAAAPAPTLGSTGVIARRIPLTVTEGLVEFTVIAPPWHPGVTARRWISIPVGARLLVDPQGEFLFPRGTVVVQHYVVAKTSAPLETHVLTFDGQAAHSRVARAAAYRWSESGVDPMLVQESDFSPLPGDASGRWLSPAPEGDLNLDLSVAGFVLPLSPRQLDPAQRDQWIARGWISPEAVPASAPSLAALDDTDAPLELRVRSFLDANCASCHRPGALGRGNFDARFVTPLSAQKIIEGELVAGDLGITGAKVVVPGDPARSMLLARLLRADALRMPPIMVSDEPSPAAELVAAWIQSTGPSRH